MAVPVERPGKRIVGMRHFRILRRIGKRLEGTYGLPVFICGEVDIVYQNIMGSEIPPHMIQLLRRRDLPGILRRAFSAGEGLRERKLHGIRFRGNLRRGL